MNVGDKIAYFYIKRIKRWMECPVCHRKMTFSKSRKSWICNDCTYAITEDEFLDNFVLWFCDECNTYLNNQDGFDKKASQHICTKCGYLNDTTFDNIKGTCNDCGKILHNPDASLCEDCKQERKRKAKEWLVKAGKIAGVAAVVAGTVYIASQSSGRDDADYTPLPDWSGDDEGDNEMNDYPTCKTCGAKMTQFDGWAWYTCPKCENKVRIIDGITTWYDEIFKSGKKEHRSDFELADFCHGGDLTED